MNNYKPTNWVTLKKCRNSKNIKPAKIESGRNKKYVQTWLVKETGSLIKNLLSKTPKPGGFTREFYQIFEKELTIPLKLLQEI